MVVMGQRETSISVMGTNAKAQYQQQALMPRTMINDRWQCGESSMTGTSVRTMINDGYQCQELGAFESPNHEVLAVMLTSAALNSVFTELCAINIF